MEKSDFEILQEQIPKLSQDYINAVAEERNCEYEALQHINESAQVLYRHIYSNTSDLSAKVTKLCKEVDLARLAAQRAQSILDRVNQLSQVVDWLEIYVDEIEKKLKAEMHQPKNKK